MSFYSCYKFLVFFVLAPFESPSWTCYGSQFELWLIASWQELILLFFFSKICCTIIYSRLWIYNLLLVSCNFFLVSSHSRLKLVSPYKILDQVLTFWVACSKNILIHIKFYVELLEFEVSWTTKNCGFSRLVGSTIGCVGWATFEVGFVTSTTEIIGLTCKWTWKTSNTCYVLV